MTNSTTRIGWAEFQKLAPAAYASLKALSQAVAASGIENDLLELVKLRASQINHCAFCTQYHLNEARNLGVPVEKADLLAVWREVDVFSMREQAALAWTELLTLIADNHVTDGDYAAVSAQFSTAEVASLSAAIGLINAWNRIAGPLKFAPPVLKHAKELTHA